MVSLIASNFWIFFRDPLLWNTRQMMTPKINCKWILCQCKTKHFEASSKMPFKRCIRNCYLHNKLLHILNLLLSIKSFRKRKRREGGGDSPLFENVFFLKWCPFLESSVNDNKFYPRKMNLHFIGQKEKTIIIIVLNTIQLLYLILKLATFFSRQLFHRHCPNMSSFFRCNKLSCSHPPPFKNQELELVRTPLNIFNHVLNPCRVNIIIK